MSTHKAIVVTEVGKPVVVASKPTIQPGSKQVQVRVTVSAINPHDGKSRDWGLFTDNRLPLVLANDVVGVVTTLGPEATKYKVGDRIFSQAGFDNFQNGLQEYAILDERYSSKIPEGLSEHDVATLPTNIIAPWVAIFDKSALAIPLPWTEEGKSFDYAGTQLLILGGGSNCGRFGVQIAKLAGIGKIVVVGGDETELKKTGATHVLDRHGGHDVVLERIRDIVGDDLVYAYDAINPPPGQILGIDALSNTKEGKFARLLPMGPVDDSKIHGKKAGYKVLNVFGSSHARDESCAPFWENIGTWLAEGKITPLSYVVVNGLDADKANEVFDAYRDGKKVTQTHFRISE